MKNSLKERAVAMLLAMALIIGMVPSSIVAAADTPVYGTVEGITADAVVTDPSGEAPVVSYAAAELDWAPKNISIGRMYDGWWIGIKITAPEGMTTKDDFVVDGSQYVKYQTGVGDGWSDDKSFWNAQDSNINAEDTPRYLTMWGMLDETILKNANLNGTSVTYRWQFDWDMDGVFEQLVTLSIDPSSVILTKDSATVYPAESVGYGTLEMLTGGAQIAGNGTANVQVQHNTETAIIWYPADYTIGRYQDGWWAGMKITAPAGISAEQLQNVHYMSGANLREFWAAKDSADDAAEHYMTMWVPLNNLLSGTMAPYTYRFDWNNDGIFEQTVTLTVDPEKVTLTKDGVQVYPALGAVSTYTGGTVSGSETGEVIVTVEETTLNWSPTDTSIGRNEDAWWAGIRVEAPAGLTEEQLRNVQYQRKDADEWSADKSFWTNKDSQEGAATHFIGMWIPLTPASIAAAIENGENITREYRFDWDNDGTYEQHIVFTIVPSDKIKLNTLEQSGFAFETETPVDQWVGSTYQNVATGGQSGETVQYEIVEGPATISADGTVTFTGLGKVTVKATRPGNDIYKDATATYVVTAIKNAWEPFAFAVSNPTITYEVGLTYPNGSYKNDLTGSDSTVTYAIVDNDSLVTETTVAKIDSATGILTVQTAGTVTVRATRAADDRYEEATAEYTLTIEKADQPDFGFDNPPSAITWQADPVAALKLVNGLGKGNVTWTVISGEDVASVDTDGKITLKKAGTFTIQAQKAGDDCYNASSPISTTIQVNRAKQTGFGFSEKEHTVTYNDNGNQYTQAATGGQSSKEIEYTVIDGDAASVGSGGVVTILKAGTVTIQATRPADDCYLAASDTYKLVINFDSQAFTFENGDEINVTYGTTEYTNEVAFIGKYSETSALKYTLSENTIGAIIDETTGKITIADSETKVGTVTVTATKAADDCYSEYSHSYTLKVSYLETDSEPTVTGDKLNDSEWYTGNVKILAPEGFTISTDNALSTSDWSDYVPFTEEGQGKTAVVYLKNAQGYITDAIEVGEISIDTAAPENLKIEYADDVVWETILEQLFGFQKHSVVVTFSADDATSGVAKVEYSKDGGQTYEEATKTGGSYTATVAPEYRGMIISRVTDVAGNSITSLTDADLDNDGTMLVLDSIPPEVTISYSGELRDSVEADGTQITRQTVTTVDDSTRFVYSGTVTATVKVKEANFFDGGNVHIVIERDGAVVTDCAETDWVNTPDTEEYKKVITLAKDGDYVITIDYADKSANDMEWTSDEYAGKQGKAYYVSNILTVDTAKPVVTIDYGYSVEDEANSVSNGTYYNADRTATVTVSDRNFRPNEVNLTIKHQDAKGGSTGYVQPNLAVWAAWTDKGNDTWEAQIPFNVDANYELTFDYKDIAQNAAETKTASFTVDKAEPEELKITYDNENANLVEEIINKLTFGVLYFQDTTKVTLTATDQTSGMDYFVLNAKADGSEGATTVKLPVDLVISADGRIVSGEQGDVKNITANYDNGTMTVTFEIPAQYRGEFTFDAVDKAARKESYHDDCIVVVDTIAPTRTVSYTPDRIVSLADMKDVDTLAEGDPVVMYFNTDAVATIRVKEANFFADDITIMVNGTAAATDNGWTNVGSDTWQATVTIQNEGDYVITMAYPDRSNNEMVSYESQRIVIDKTPPVINVSYGNADVQNTINGRQYFDDVQTATIKITEHNFRADDVTVKVSAQNAIGTDVLKLNADGTVASYASQASNRDSWSANIAGTWRRADDTYELTLTFDADANYTFDIDYQDLATNGAADYAADSFTVDKTPPSNLTVSYSTSVLEQVLESITFGYYNAKMTVTITAVDETTGIYHFAYSYINSKGVSSVNAELLDQAIRSTEITYKGNQATATFTIPKMVLGNDNQFNGTVEFTAYDCSENSTKLEDSKRIIIDNISPTANISYNAPVQEVNGVSYHDGSITATIVINEANFTSGDVNVTVTKDGADYPVAVSWVNNSVDTHTGTFTLTEDGDYIVSVQYRDKSGNQMNAYTSNQLTLDTTIPVIEVSNIKMNSANKDAVYSFTLTVNDTNLDASSLNPMLTAVVKGENGNYQTKEIALGDAQVIVAGQTYTYTIDDLPEDALYSLTCSVKDLSGNAVDQILLADGKSYETVQFSINRDGSAFGFGDAFTENLVGQYYVYSVDEDVVIVEVNVDPIENYAVKLNGVELVEGVDYTTAQTSKDGEWSQRTYIISKDLFVEEGEYSLIVSSVDKAESTAYSDVKNLSVAFIVDQTAPVITISGLVNGGRYQTDEQTVTLIPSDEGGRLNSLTVIVMDANGNPLKDESGNDISVRFEMSGEELLAYLEENDGKITFTVPEGLENQVQIICNDCAVNANGETNAYNETFKKVTVSQSQLVIFYANKPLFYGTIAGVLLLLAMIILLVKWKTDKSKAKKAKAEVKG